MTRRELNDGGHFTGLDAGRWAGEVLECITMNWPSLLRRVGWVRQLEAEVKRLRLENAELRRELEPWQRYHPPGHYYSPLATPAEAAAALARLSTERRFAAVDLNAAEQVARLERLAERYADQPFPEEPQPEFRYHLHNGSYGAFDGIMLYGMLRELRPQRVVEIGSGFSTAALLDLNERLLGGSLQLTVIDPDLSRLRALLRPADADRMTLVEQRVQDVPIDTFAALGERDVLFIDSSHVSKVGSDVNHLLFEVLPRLRSGVWIHFHDVMANFEYPMEWYQEGRAWNEQYLLRAFLMYNPVFRIALWSGWLFHERHDLLRERMPLCARGGGGQIWLRKEG